MTNNVVFAHGAFIEETCYTTKEPYCGTVAPVIDHNTYDGDGSCVWRRRVLSTLPAWKSASGDTLPAVPKDFTGLSRAQGAAYDRGAFELKPRS